ncbi:PaaI family thioesterase [Parasedimentitalea maritima]|uniref:Medium/long-chain acyl-CoA thioesterase YigI n=1 Tax=Parasedimentitalea maritima TaxID=2578117 RepID=A0A6A4R7F1_9RHOB|nr:PaaI family thioesterase [Zongyanglinia marina]KAE9627341.1 hotdog fold thioesterase [Zongyanglinia marina]
MTDIGTRIRDSFARQSMMQTLGAEIDEVGEGKVVITAPILPSSRQQHDVAHAALSFAIGDTAAGYAALTKMPDDQEVMTAEIKINLLAPGAGDYLRATGRVIKPGRRLVVVTAEVHAITGASEKLIAILQGTMVPVAKQG